MKRLFYFSGFFPIFILAGTLFAASFQVYPGAKLLDVYEIKQPEVPGKKSTPAKEIVFTTNDPFEGVVAFYRGLAREYRIPGSAGGRGTPLPSGQELREAYFIFDNAGDLSTSKHWVKIQRPYFGREGFQGKFAAGRNVTAIIEEDKRGYP